MLTDPSHKFPVLLYQFEIQEECSEDYAGRTVCQSTYFQINDEKQGTIKNEEIFGLSQTLLNKLNQDFRAQYHEYFDELSEDERADSDCFRGMNPKFAYSDFEISVRDEEWTWTLYGPNPVMDLACSLSVSYPLASINQYIIKP